MLYYKDYNFCEQFETVGNKTRYYNVPMSFDIETSNFKVGEFKCANMYIWQFGVDYTAVYGRTWDDFKEWLGALSERLCLNKHLKAIIYVHNLGFEFQFIRKLFPIKKLFAREPRKPMYFHIGNFIFKDSLCLSGLSLLRTLQECKSKYAKTDGLDYSLMRHSGTPLVDEEMEYCEIDVLGLNDFIRSEMRKNGGDITKIPTTKTGYIRREMREACLADPEFKVQLSEQLTTDPKIFKLLQAVFAGAYTHGNYLKIGCVFNNVGSYDFTSSYPAVMLRKKYPSSRFHPMRVQSIEQLLGFCKKYACIMCITLHNVKAKNSIHPISKHKCAFDNKTLVEDNGKVVSCSYLTLSVCDVDFLDICSFYEFDKIDVHQFYYANKDYLPKPIVETMCKLYREKCVYKHDPEKQDVYITAKNKFNSGYGMMVTNPVSPRVTYSNDIDDWCIEPMENFLQKELIKIKNSKNTFLNYAWGVYVTAYARHELFIGINECIDDWIYADTDSMKLTNPEKYRNFIDDYNKHCTEEVKTCLEHYGINYDDYIPSDMPIGVWDWEGYYDRFKTLGAKRYAFVRNGNFGYTVSGLPKAKKASQVQSIERKGKEKKNALDWILYDNPDGMYGMDYFQPDMDIPAAYSGKLCSHYNDDGFTCKLVDYKGIEQVVHEESCINLSPVGFKMSFADEFIDYLCGEETPMGFLIHQIINGGGGYKTYG